MKILRSQLTFTPAVLTTVLDIFRVVGLSDWIIMNLEVSHLPSLTCSPYLTLTMLACWTWPG
jgi:hypothetical protein